MIVPFCSWIGSGVVMGTAYACSRSKLSYESISRDLLWRFGRRLRRCTAKIAAQTTSTASGRKINKKSGWSLGRCRSDESAGESVEAGEADGDTADVGKIKVGKGDAETLGFLVPDGLDSAGNSSGISGFNGAPLSAAKGTLTESKQLPNALLHPAPQNRTPYPQIPRLEQHPPSVHVPYTPPHCHPGPCLPIKLSDIASLAMFVLMQETI